MSANSNQHPRVMKWEQNGELAHKDLSDLINRLIDAETESNGDELSRLGAKSNINK